METPPNTPAAKKQKTGKEGSNQQGPGKGGQQKGGGMGSLIPQKLPYVTPMRPLYMDITLIFENNWISYPDKNTVPPCSIDKSMGLMCLDTETTFFYLQEWNPNGQQPPPHPMNWSQSSYMARPGLPKVLKDLWPIIFETGYIIEDAEITLDGFTSIQKQLIDHADGSQQYLLQQTETPVFRFYQSTDGRVNNLSYAPLSAGQEYKGYGAQVIDNFSAHNSQFWNKPPGCADPQLIPDAYFNIKKDIDVKQGFKHKPDFDKGARVVPALNPQDWYLYVKPPKPDNTDDEYNHDSTWSLKDNQMNPCGYFSQYQILPQKGGRQGDYYDARDGFTLPNQYKEYPNRQFAREFTNNQHHKEPHQIKPLVFMQNCNPNLTIQTTFNIKRKIVMTIPMGPTSQNCYINGTYGPATETPQEFANMMQGQAEQRRCPVTKEQWTYKEAPDSTTNYIRPKRNQQDHYEWSSKAANNHVPRHGIIFPMATKQKCNNHNNTELYVPAS